MAAPWLSFGQHSIIEAPEYYKVFHFASDGPC